MGVMLAAVCLCLVLLAGCPVSGQPEPICRHSRPFSLDASLTDPVVLIGAGEFDSDPKGDTVFVSERGPANRTVHVLLNAVAGDLKTLPTQSVFGGVVDGVVAVSGLDTGPAAVDGILVWRRQSPGRIALWNGPDHWDSSGSVLFDESGSVVLAAAAAHDANGDGHADVLALVVDPVADAVLVAVWHGDGAGGPMVRAADVVLGSAGEFQDVSLDGSLSMGLDGILMAAISDTDAVGLHAVGSPISTGTVAKVPDTAGLKPTHVVAYRLDDDETVDVIAGSSFEGKIRVSLRANASAAGGLAPFVPLFADITEGPGGEFGGLTDILVLNPDNYPPAEVFVSLPSAYSVMWGQAVQDDGTAGGALWQRYLVDRSVAQLAAVDLDGDGSPPEILAAINKSPYEGIVWSITVRPSLGFSGKKELLASSVGVITAHDMDLDGDIDIVFNSGSYVSYLANQDNTGAFGVRVDISSSTSLVKTFEIADLDGDGTQELVAGCEDYTHIWSILGGGSFGPQTTVAGLSGDTVNVKVGDLNGDGFLDLAMWTYKSYSVWGVAWNPNDGAGGWDGWQSISTKTLVRDGALGDVDGDGVLDVIYIASGVDIRWLKNNLNVTTGEITWTTHMGAAVGGGARYIRVGNLNNDPYLDIVVNNHYGDHYQVLINDGAGVFTFYTLSYINEPARMHLADINGDGTVDILGGSNYASSPRSAYWLNADSTGTAWGSTTDLASPTDGYVDIHGVDVTADGRTDIIIAADSLWLMVNEPPALRALDQSETVVEAPDITGPRMLITADVDNDGVMDLVAGGDSSSPNALYVVSMSANGSMSTPIRVTSDPYIMGVAVVDMSLDGRPDLVWTSATTGVVGWTQQTSPRVWAASFTTIVTVTSPRSVRVADIDGDGLLDVVTVSYADGDALWVRSTSAGGLGWALPLVVASSLANPVDVLVMDGDGDGDLDVVTSVRYGDQVILSVNTDGAGAFASTPTVLLSADEPYYMTPTDLDGDLDEDIVVAVYGGGDIYWIENVGGVLSTSHVLSLGTPGALHTIVLDADSDGDMDVLYVSHTSDSVSLLTNGGDTTFGSPTVLATDIDGPWHLAAHDWMYDDGYVEVAVSATNDDEVILLETASARLIPSTYSEEDLLCTSLACIESAIKSGDQCTRKIINLLPTTISTCFSESHHVIGVRNVHIRAKDGPGTVTVSCGSSYVGTAMFLIRGLANMVVEGITFVGGNANALSNLPRHGAWVVQDEGTVLQFVDCAVVGVGGGFVSAIDGGSLLLTRVVVNDTLLQPLSAYAKSQIPVEDQAVHGGSVVRARGVRTIVRMSDVTVRRTGAAASNPDVVGGTVLVEASAQMEVVLDRCVFSDSVGNVHAGGTIAVVTGISPAVPGFSFTVRDSVFTGSSAVWGGTIAVMQTSAELPPSQLVPPSSGDVTPPAVPVMTTPFVALKLVRVAMQGSSAVYGGVVYVCGSKIEATLASDTLGLEGTASGGGALGFVCHSPGASPHMYAQPLDHPWLGDLAGWPGSGTLANPASSYGPRWASNWAALEWARAHPRDLVLGVSAADPALIRAVDIFGNTVVDAQAQVRVHAEPTSGSAGLAGTAALTESAAGVVALSVETPSVLVGWKVIGITADAVGLEWDIVAVPERRVLLGPATAVAGLELRRPSATPVVTTACPVGMGVDPGALDPSLAVVPTYTCTPCGEGQMSSATSLDPCVTVVTCAEPSVSISVSQCLICPDDSTFDMALFGRLFGNVSDPDPALAAASCVCNAGFWSPENRAPTAPCVACPRGGVCDGRGGRPTALSGFYDVHGGVGDPKYVECPREALCVGGAPASQCRKGSHGYLCSQCDQDWYPSSDGLCDECPKIAVGLVVTVVTVSVVAGLVSVVVVVFSSSRANSGKSRRTRRIPRALSTAIVYCQILGIIGSGEFKWPSNVRSAMNFAGAANVDMSVFATPCTLGSFFAAYVFSVSVPLVFVVTTVLAAALLRPRRMVEIVRKVLLSFVPLVYIPTSRSALVWFDCTQLPNGRFWLDADLSVECFTGTWLTLLPLGLAAAVLYVVLPLCVIGWVLAKNWNQLKHPDVLARYGMLYTIFSTKYAGWLVVVLVKRLGVVVVSLFFSQMRLLLIGMMIGVFLTNLVVQVKRRPFRLDNHNTLEQRLDVVIIVILMIGAGFLSDDWPNSRTRSAFEVVVLIVMVLGFMCLVWSGATELKGSARIEPSDEDAIITQDAIEFFDNEELASGGSNNAHDDMALCSMTSSSSFASPSIIDPADHSSNSTIDGSDFDGAEGTDKNSMQMVASPTRRLTARRGRRSSAMM